MPARSMLQRSTFLLDSCWTSLVDSARLQRFAPRSVPAQSAGFAGADGRRPQEGAPALLRKGQESQGLVNDGIRISTHRFRLNLSIHIAYRHIACRRNALLKAPRRSSYRRQDDLGVVSLGRVKKLSRRPEQIETLNFHAAVDVPTPGEQRRVSDPARVEATVAQFEAGLRDSLESPSRIRGWVSDQLFGLVAADLGGCKLVKQEDSGILFYEDEVKLPDWRLTLVSGRNILVEVKAEDDNHPRLSKLRLAEVARLTSYAELNDCPLYIAVHWVAMSMWTLVPVGDYVRVGDHLEIGLETAFKRNHMCSLLNDRMLGLKPPLEFRMTMQEVPDESVATEVAREPEEDGTWQQSVVTTGVHIFAGGEEMVDENETALVWFLIRHARWPCEEKVEVSGEGVWEMVFTMAPNESPAEQGFDIIGSLSELYTRMFYSGTTSLEDETTKLGIDVEPGTLPRLVPTDLKSERLPLWHFHLNPSGPTEVGDSEGG